MLFGGAGAAVIWAGFSLNPLSRLLACEPFEDGTPCPGPTSWPLVFIGPNAPHTTGGGRIMWTDGNTGEPGKQPGHGNYFCLLGGDDAQRARFRERFGAFGEYQAPARLPRPVRDLEAEIRAVLAGCAVGMSKTALPRAIGARKHDALRAIDALISAGEMVANGKRWTLARAPETVPQGREPRKRGSSRSGTARRELSGIATAWCTVCAVPMVPTSSGNCAQCDDFLSRLRRGREPRSSGSRRSGTARKEHA